MGSLVREVWVREDENGLPQQTSLWADRLRTKEVREGKHRIVCYVPAEKPDAGEAQP